MASVMQELYILGAAGMVAQPFFLTGNCYLPQSRCQIVEAFLRSDATDLFFVDDDLGFQVGAMTAMAKTRRPVIGGVYPKKVEGEVKWPVVFPEEFLKVEPDGAVKAARLPTGFLRINRQVFIDYERELKPARLRDITEKICTEYFKTDIQPGATADAPGLFLGEDFGFTKSWCGIGGECWVWPDIDFAHWGRRAWRGNWGKWSLAKLADKHKTDYLAARAAAE